MENPLVELVEHEFSQLDIRGTRLVHQLYRPQSFGDAEAVYQVGNVRLRFRRDRGDDTIYVGSTNSPRRFYNFDDVAVWMSWVSFDDVLKHGRPTDFDNPPPGPIFGLSKALGLVARDLKKLDEAFSAAQLMSTHAELTDMERRRVAST